MFPRFLSSAAHVSHLENVSEEEMNRLLGIVLDVEYLFTCVHREEDADTKQVYFYLFKVRFHPFKKAFLLSLSHCSDVLRFCILGRGWEGSQLMVCFARRVCGSMHFSMRESLK